MKTQVLVSRKRIYQSEILADVVTSHPKLAEVIAWAGQLQWLLVLWGYWIDKHRHGPTHA